MPPCHTCTPTAFPAHQGVSSSPKSLYYHLKFSPPVVNISCTGTKSFPDLFSILSLLKLTIFNFLFNPGLKLTPKFSLFSPLFSFPFSLFCAFLYFPSCPPQIPPCLLHGEAGTWQCQHGATRLPQGLAEHVLCPHFQVDILSARNPIVYLEKTKV